MLQRFIQEQNTRQSENPTETIEANVRVELDKPVMAGQKTVNHSNQEILILPDKLEIEEPLYMDPVDMVFRKAVKNLIKHQVRIL